MIKSKHKKWLALAPLIFVAVAALLGWVVMFLWNAVLVPVLGVGIITFWQALGIFILSKILFGGFHGGKSHRWKHRYYNKERWDNMTDEEKERFKQEWGRRCGWDRMRKSSDENIQS